MYLKTIEVTDRLAPPSECMAREILDRLGLELPQADSDPVAPLEVAPVPAVPARGRMVIVIANGRRVIVDSGVDAAALARVLEVLERR